MLVHERDPRRLRPCIEAQKLRDGVAVVIEGSLERVQPIEEQGDIALGERIGLRLGPALRSPRRMRQQQAGEQAVVAMLLADRPFEDRRLDAARDRRRRARHVDRPARLAIDDERIAVEHLEPAGDAIRAAAVLVLAEAEPAGELVAEREQSARVLLEERGERLGVQSSIQVRGQTGL
jgi:hypothetical protein